MRSLTGENSGWLRKTTSVGMIPLLLTQVLIAFLCVPQTLTAGMEIRREMTLEELREFLSGEEQFTILLSEGGAVRGNGITILADSIHLDHITRATDGQQHPTGSDTSIATGSIKEIRVAKMRGSLRWSGGVGFGVAGFLCGYVMNAAEPRRIKNQAIGTAVLVGLPVGGATLGYWLGKRKDHETTIITIVD